MAALPPTRITAPTGFHQGSPCSEIPVKSSLSAPTPPLGRAVRVDIWWQSVFRGGSGEEFPEGGRGSRDRQSPVHPRASPRTVDRGGHRPWGWGPGRGRPPPRTGWNSTGPSSRCPTPPGLRPPPPPQRDGGSAWRYPVEIRVLERLWTRFFPGPVPWHRIVLAIAPRGDRGGGRAPHPTRSRSEHLD
ncbi:hypothetical protein MBBA_1825 [Methanoculleus bourgensis]|jgi:hypothetical protein|nr:hypothetical protein MBBA_1825 [Methanoculleus bourgensis]